MWVFLVFFLVFFYVVGFFILFVWVLVAFFVCLIGGIWLCFLKNYFNSFIPGAVRMLSCCKVLEIIPSFPDFGVTYSLNISPLVNYAFIYLPSNLTVSFQGFTILLS